ncbi:DUF1805 domain-containing protein [Candidatus Bathyarchaeota archaeon]|nr:DUF1805 domain-containing protein [Candidatus Bathyarchaeota archaeon]
MYMVTVTPIKIDGKKCLGVKVELPDSPPMILIIAEKGFVMCGFLNVEAAEKLNVAAAVVSGVKNFKDVLNAEVKAVTSKAKNMGVNIKMKGVEALKRMF